MMTLYDRVREGSDPSLHPPACPNFVLDPAAQKLLDDRQEALHKVSVSFDYDRLFVEFPEIDRINAGMEFSYNDTLDKVEGNIWAFSKDVNRIELFDHWVRFNRDMPRDGTGLQVNKLEEEASQGWALCHADDPEELLITLLVRTFGMLTAIHTDVLKEAPIARTREDKKKAKRAKRSAPNDFKYIKLTSLGHEMFRESDSHADRSGPRAHFVRRHPRELPNGNTVWVRSHVRGKGDPGRTTPTKITK